MEFGDLLELLDNLHNRQLSIDPAEFTLLLQGYRDKFSNLLAYKGPNPASRAQVESLKVLSPKYGDQRLDEEPDKRLALLLSSELKIDEVHAVELLITAAEERGAFTAEAAAGIHLEERQTCLKCLLRLLTDVVSGTLHSAADAEAPHPYSALIRSFVDSLLESQAPAAAQPPPGAPPAAAAAAAPGNGGAPLLLSRLIELLKDHSLEPGPGSALPAVSDEAGILASRALLSQLERRLLCKCLLLALFINQRAMGPAGVAELLDLLQGLLARASRSGWRDAFAAEQAHLVLLGCVLALTPQEERGAQERPLLAALRDSPALAAKICPPGPPADGAAAVLRLCLGLLGPLSSQGLAGGALEDARRKLLEAAGAGAFRYLRQVFAAPYFRMDDAVHQQLVSCTVYRLVGQALQADAATGGAVAKAMAERCMAPFRPAAAAAAAAAAAPAGPPGTPGTPAAAGGGLGSWSSLFGSGGAAAAPPGPTSSSLAPAGSKTQGDHLGHVLTLLAAAFTVHPQLWLNPDQPSAMFCRQPVEAFISRTVFSEEMRCCPEVRVPFLELMTGLAVGDYGTAMVLRQFAEMSRVPKLELLTWRKLFATVIEYCVRYSGVLAEAQRQGGGGGRGRRGGGCGAGGAADERARGGRAGCVPGAVQAAD